jgi:DNA polymerase-3 subunit delta'
MTSNVQRFLEAAQNKKVLGAYLLVCSRPDVTARLTNEFLMRLFCANGGCGKCIDCRKVTEGHVDILRICAPKVAELRDALAYVAEKPYEGAYKAVVISAADDMTPAAANSLLKTLEEPPTGVVFLLEVRSVSGVLPTIASRCAIVTITPEPNAREAIAKALNVDSAEAAILADLSGGYLDEARRIKADAEFLGRRDDVLSLTHKLLYTKGMAISTFADFLENSKECLIPLLCVMQTYLRDILVYQKTRNAYLVVNQDRLNDVLNAADDFTSGAISNMIKVILETEKWFFVAVNFRLAIEKMLFRILEEKYGCIKS